MTDTPALIPFDCELRIGDSLTFEMTAKDENDVVVNITGATITWKLAIDPGEAPILSFALGSGITITDGPNGIFEVLIDPINSATLSELVYYHEARILKGPDEKVVAIGFLAMKPKLT